MEIFKRFSIEVAEKNFKRTCLEVAKKICKHGQRDWRKNSNVKEISLAIHKEIFKESKTKEYVERISERDFQNYCFESLQRNCLNIAKENDREIFKGSTGRLSKGITKGIFEEIPK